MIEAIKSTIAAAPFVQKGLEQNSSARSLSAQTEEVRDGAEGVDAVYVSPNVRVDSRANVTILEFRDSRTGDVLSQVPSEAQLKAYKKNQGEEEAELFAKFKGIDKRIIDAEARGDESGAAIARAQAGVFAEQIKAQIERSV